MIQFGFILLGIVLHQFHITLGVTTYRGVSVDNGVIHLGIRSVSECFYRCRRDAPDICAGADYDYSKHRCFLHGPDTECGEMKVNKLIIHIRRITCDSVTTLKPTTAQPEKVPDIKSLKTSYFETYIPGGVLVPGLVTEKACYEHCYTRESCAGVDFNFLTYQCYEHSAKTECSDLKIKTGTQHYRIRHDCNLVYSSNCENIFIQELPVNHFRRFGGVKIADDVDYESCVEMCKVSAVCQAIDWDVTQRSCWQYDTALFPLAGECCRHARKVCTDQDKNQEVRRDTAAPSQYKHRSG